MRRAVCLAMVVGGCGFRVTPNNAPASPDAVGASGDASIDAPSGGCVDADQDGICDSVDDWLCGTKPVAPGDPATLGRPVWLAPNPSNVAGLTLNGNGSVIVATSGATIDLRYAYGVQANCPSGSPCRAQIEYGFAGGARLGCMFDGTIYSGVLSFGLTGHDTFALPAGSAKYQLLAQVAFGSSCGSQTTWSGAGEPASTQAVGYICVP